MKKKSNIGWWIAGAAALFVLKKKAAAAVEGIGATKKFYVYAGYYENYISSKPMPKPYILRRTFRSINAAINYAESFGDYVVYCDNVKYDLPDFIYDATVETDGFFKY